MLTLKELIFEKVLEYKLENSLKNYYYLYIPYFEWKNKNYTNCSCCNIFIKKKYKCEICLKYYYCQNCWDDYTYHCFLCSKDHCFTCNSKIKSCYICKFNRRNNILQNN